MAAEVMGYRVSGIEQVGVEEAAFHRYSSRLYELVAFDARGAFYFETPAPIRH